MTAKVRSSATCPRKKRNNLAQKNTKRNNMANVYVRSSKINEPVKARVTLLQSETSSRIIYCQMYEQEERDIARAVAALSKFTR